MVIFIPEVQEWQSPKAALRNRKSKIDDSSGVKKREMSELSGDLEQYVTQGG